MRTRNSLIAALVLGLALTAAAGDKKPPQPYALLFGTVFDTDGRSLSGVPVKIKRAGDKKAKWELISNSTGEFAQRLPAGKADYVVWADVKDKAVAERSALTVHFENDERQDVALHLTKEKK